MYRTTNTTESMLSLGEKLQSHGWKRLSLQDKKRVVTNINRVAAFIRPIQHAILCEVFALEYKEVPRRPAGKTMLEDKIRQAQLARRRANAAKLNLEWS
jgi:hypothetical protein